MLATALLRLRLPIAAVGAERGVLERVDADVDRQFDAFHLFDRIEHNAGRRDSIPAEPCLAHNRVLEEARRLNEAGRDGFGEEPFVDGITERRDKPFSAFDHALHRFKQARRTSSSACFVPTCSAAVSRKVEHLAQLALSFSRLVEKLSRRSRRMPKQLQQSKPSSRDYR